MPSICGGMPDALVLVHRSSGNLFLGLSPRIWAMLCTSPTFVLHMACGHLVMAGRRSCNHRAVLSLGFVFSECLLKTARNAITNPK